MGQQGNGFGLHVAQLDVYFCPVGTGDAAVAHTAVEVAYDVQQVEQEAKGFFLPFFLDPAEGTAVPVFDDVCHGKVVEQGLRTEQTGADGFLLRGSAQRGYRYGLLTVGDVLGYVFELFFVDAAQGEGETADGEYQTAVAGDAEDVAFHAVQRTAYDADQRMAFGIVIQSVGKEAEALGIEGGDAHEGLHLAVGDDGYVSGGAVAHKVMSGEVFTQMGGDGGGVALDEEQTGHRGAFYLYHSLAGAQVGGGGVNVGGKMNGEGGCHALYTGVVEKKVAPRGAGGLGMGALAARVYFYFRTYSTCLCGLGMRGAYGGGRKGLGTIQ